MKTKIFTLLGILLLPLLSVAVQAASWKLDRVAVMIDEGKKVSLKVCGGSGLASFHEVMI